MNKLSSREKMLIYIMVCVALTIGSLLFIISPLKKMYESNLDTNETLKTQKLTMNMSLGSADSYKSLYETKKAEVTEAEKNFYSGLTEKEIDRALTGKMLKHNLLPLNISFTHFTEELPSATDDDDNQDKKETEEPISYLDNVRADISAKGDLNSIYGLLNELSMDDKSVVTDILIDTDKESYVLNASVKYYILK